MALVSEGLSRNKHFLDDFKNFAESPVALIERLLDRMDQEGRRLTESEASEAAKPLPVAAEKAESVSSVLAYLAARATPERMADVNRDLTDLAERAGATMSEELGAILTRRLSTTSPIVLAQTEARALSTHGSVYQMRFRPTVVLAADDSDRGIAGMLCEIHYHDSDDEQHDVTFMLTAARAEEISKNLDAALKNLQRLRERGTVSIANVVAQPPRGDR